jgi:hypothetical protein
VANGQELDVAPVALGSTGITMVTVVHQLETIKDAIDREAGSGLPGVGLPFLAFSALGELARYHYQVNCATASERIGKLLADARDLADGLAKNAVAYVGTESELSGEIKEFDHKIEAADDPAVSSSSAGIVENDVFWAVGLTGAGGVSIYEALAVKSVSQELSERTAAVLKVAGRYSIAAIASGIAWAASAVVRSDELLNTASITWKHVGTTTSRIFSEEVAELREVLFTEWISPMASPAAAEKFGDFEQSGRDFADWVNRHMATSIDKAITDLNNIHTWAFGFATTQLMALAAFVVFPAFSQVIGVYLNATFTVVMNVIGMALGVFWLNSDVLA